MAGLPQVHATLNPLRALVGQAIDVAATTGPECRDSVAFRLANYDPAPIRMGACNTETTLARDRRSSSGATGTSLYLVREVRVIFSDTEPEFLHVRLTAPGALRNSTYSATCWLLAAPDVPLQRRPRYLAARERFTGAG